MQPKFQFSPQQDSNLSLLFDPISVTYVQYDPTWHSTLHYHNFIEIFYFLDGEGTLQTDYGIQPVHRHSLAIMNPYIEHTESSSAHNPLSYIVIAVKGPTLNFANLSFDNGVYLYDDTDQMFSPFITTLLTELNAPKHYSAHIMSCLINTILLILSHKENYQLPNTTQLVLSPNVALAKQYIDTHYSQNITLADLEKCAHISRYRLAHLFKQELNIAPIAYLLQVRFAHAKELLEQTNHTIVQISEVVGFNSTSYFSNKFKELYGTTPTQYRAMYREYK